MMWPCEFNEDLSIVSQDKVQTNHFWSKFDILMSPVTLERPKKIPVFPLTRLTLFFVPTLQFLLLSRKQKDFYTYRP